MGTWKGDFCTPPLKHKVGRDCSRPPAMTMGTSLQFFHPDEPFFVWNSAPISEFISQLPIEIHRRDGGRDRQPETLSGGAAQNGIPPYRAGQDPGADRERDERLGPRIFQISRHTRSVSGRLMNVPAGRKESAVNYSFGRVYKGKTAPESCKRGISLPQAIRF